FQPTNELMKPGQDVNISNSLENLNLVDSYSGINQPASIMTKAYKAPRLTTSHVSAPRSPVQDLVLQSSQTCIHCMIQWMGILRQLSGYIERGFQQDILRLLLSLVLIGDCEKRERSPQSKQLGREKGSEDRQILEEGSPLH
ncbi:unnamed protein product, partial [Timema podura]|nr:unnamed protein product [Timema podura]